MTKYEELCNLAKKLPPLKCPQCSSEKVLSTVSVGKKSGRTISCYDCKKTTKPNGDVEEFKGSNRMYGRGANPWIDTGNYRE